MTRQFVLDTTIFDGGNFILSFGADDAADFVLNGQGRRLDICHEMYETYPVIRIQLHLTESQDRRLKKLAQRSGRTRADLIRSGVELLLSGDAAGEDPLLSLLGAAGPAGRSDISERHDDVLYAADSASSSWPPKSS